MNSYEIFCELMKEKGVKASEVSRETGISTSTLTDWKMGRTNPKLDKMKMLSLYFNVDLDYLMGNTKIRRKAQATASFAPTTDGDNEVQDALNKIASALNVTPSDNLTERERQLLSFFSLLTDDMQQSFLDLIKSVANKTQ